MSPYDPKKMEESRVDKYKNKAMSVAIRKLKVTKSTFIKAMWEMNRFGWRERGKGKLIRIAHERLCFEVKVTKVDLKGIKIGNPFVIRISDKLLFPEVKLKLCERFGLDQNYDITYMHSGTRVWLKNDMDYEACIMHSKDVATLNGNGEDKILTMEVRLQVKAEAAKASSSTGLRVKEEF